MRRRRWGGRPRGRTELGFCLLSPAGDVPTVSGRDEVIRKEFVEFDHAHRVAVCVPGTSAQSFLVQDVVESDSVVFEEAFEVRDGHVVIEELRGG